MVTMFTTGITGLFAFTFKTGNSVLTCTLSWFVRQELHNHSIDSDLQPELRARKVIATFEQRAPDTVSNSKVIVVSDKYDFETPQLLNERRIIGAKNLRINRVNTASVAFIAKIRLLEHTWGNNGYFFLIYLPS